MFNSYNWYYNYGHKLSRFFHGSTVPHLSDLASSAWPQAEGSHSEWFPRVPLTRMEPWQKPWWTPGFFVLETTNCIQLYPIVNHRLNLLRWNRSTKRSTPMPKVLCRRPRPWSTGSFAGSHASEAARCPWRPAEACRPAAPKSPRLQGFQESVKFSNITEFLEVDTATARQNVQNTQWCYFDLYWYVISL